MAMKLEKIAEAWSSSSFPPAAALERLEPVLTFSGEIHGPPSELVAAAAEVGEALRAERPAAVRGAIEQWCEAVDWAEAAKHTEVSRLGVLAIAMDEATLQRKTLLGVAQDDALRLLRAAAPQGAVDAGLARDLLLWLELGDEKAKARIAPRFAPPGQVGLPLLSPSSRLDIALRALELVLPPSLPVEARLRRLVGAPAWGSTPCWHRSREPSWRRAWASPGRPIASPASTESRRPSTRRRPTGRSCSLRSRIAPPSSTSCWARSAQSPTSRVTAASG